MKRKPQKGEISYISSRKKITILQTSLLFTIAFAVLALGYFSTGSLQNYLTIVAVLGMLPASRAAVLMIVSLRVKMIDETLYQKLKSLTQDAAYKIQYNLYFTSEKKNYPVDALFVTNNCVIGYTTNKKCDCKDASNHISTYMKIDGYEPKIINIVAEESKFILAIKNNLNNKPTKQDLKMEHSLKLLSI